MTVIALGTFDGVHRGHQLVIKRTVQAAKKIGAKALVVTFDPHPQQVIVPQRGLRLLTTLKEREALFCALGIDRTAVIRFNERLRRLSEEEFVKKYLVEGLKVRQIFVGYDYAFGKGRSGGVAELRRLGQKYGFSVKVISPVKVGKRTVKSSLIRELISQGEFNRAVKLLGHPYQIEGRVVKGTGIGKGLGFPTANLSISPQKLIPARGVYAGRFGKYRCAINIGGRPTFGGGNETIFEAHILHFHGRLRGQRVALTVERRLRDEKQFSDVAELKKQIARDISRIT